MSSLLESSANTNAVPLEQNTAQTISNRTSKPDRVIRRILFEVSEDACMHASNARHLAQPMLPESLIISRNASSFIRVYYRLTQHSKINP